MTYGLVGAVLYAKDLGRLANFYSAVAGMEISEMDEGSATLGRLPSQLVVVQMPKHLADRVQLTSPPAVREQTPIKLVFGVADIATVRARVTELGGALNAADREWEFEGFKVCDGHDPEGNVFQLRQTG